MGGFETRPYGMGNVRSETRLINICKCEGHGLLPASYGVWVFRVFVPPCRVVRDVLAYAVQCRFVPDHVFIVIALPKRGASSPLKGVDAPGGKCLERPYDFGKAVPHRRGGFQTRPYMVNRISPYVVQQNQISESRCRAHDWA